MNILLIDIERKCVGNSASLICLSETVPSSSASKRRAKGGGRRISLPADVTVNHFSARYDQAELKERRDKLLRRTNDAKPVNRSTALHLNARAI